MGMPTFGFCPNVDGRLIAFELVISVHPTIDPSSTIQSTYIYIYISTPNINTQRSMVLFTFAQGTRTHLKCNMVSKVFPRLPRVSNQNSKLGLISKCRTRYTGIFCQFTVHLTKNQLLRAYWRHNKTKRGIYRYCHGIPLFGKNNFS